MKTALLFLLGGFALLTLFYLKTTIIFTSSTVDIHFHDTYFILGYFHFVIAVLLILGTLFSLGGVIGTRFKNRNFILLLSVMTMAMIFIIWQIRNFLAQWV